MVGEVPGECAALSKTRQYAIASIEKAPVESGLMRGSNQGHELGMQRQLHLCFTPLRVGPVAQAYRSAMRLQNLERKH